MNKLKENDYINYDDLILDYIYENKDLKLAKIIFPLVENKKLLTRFIYIIDSRRKTFKIGWIKVIFENGFNEVSKINIFAFKNKLLIHSAKNGLIEIVRYLVENGADIHVNDDYALKSASGYGHLKVVKCLVENGANIHAQDDYSLRWASYGNYMKVVKYLVEKGANVHANNDYAIKYARTFGHREIIDFLLKQSSNQN